MRQNGDQQVFVGLDGPEGIVIQTTRATYESYYRRIWYELLGEAKELPMFQKRSSAGDLLMQMRLKAEPVRSRLFAPGERER